MFLIWTAEKFWELQLSFQIWSISWKSFKKKAVETLIKLLYFLVQPSGMFICIFDKILQSGKRTKILYKNYFEN